VADGINWMPGGEGVTVHHQFTQFLAEYILTTGWIQAGRAPLAG
jgi:hypothetical protein